MAPRASTLLALLTVVLLASCASAPRSPLDDPEAMSALMVRLGDDLYTAGSERCLPLKDYSVKVIDDQHLLFRQRDTVWINELRIRCPGLRLAGRGFETLTFEKTTSRLCELDRVGTTDPLSRRPQMRPSCPLGEFRKVDAELVEQTVGIPRAN